MNMLLSILTPNTIKAEKLLLGSVHTRTGFHFSADTVRATSYEKAKIDKVALSVFGERAP